MPGAGQLNRRCEFQRRGGGAADGYGGTTGEMWLKLFDRRGAVRYGSGSERRQADRTQAVAPGILTVPSDSQTRGITSSDRAVIDGQVHAFRGPGIDPDGKRAWLEFVVEMEPGP